MPFESPEQQQWYNATDQDFLDDEPSSSRKVSGEVAVKCPNCGEEDNIEDTVGGGPQGGYHCDTCGQDFDDLDLIPEMANEPKEYQEEAGDEEDVFSMGEPEQEPENKNVIGKIDQGFTSKYDMFDPNEIPEEKSYKSDPPEDIYKDYDYGEAGGQFPNIDKTELFGYGWDVDDDDLVKAGVTDMDTTDSASDKLQVYYDTNFSEQGKPQGEAGEDDEYSPFEQEEDADLFSIGNDEDPEEISQGKMFGKYMDNTGATSKYDLFDPIEKEEEMAEATEVFYKKYLGLVSDSNAY